MLATSLLDKLPERSQLAAKNIALSIGTKGVSVIVSLLIVPMTISYVNPTRYGVWIALSQLIALCNYFDFGLSNGFKNKYAEAKAVGDIALARQYLSTTYFAISAIVIVVLVAALISNFFIDWTSVLKIDESYRQELRLVFGIVSCFFCLNMVVNIFGSLLAAEQKPGVASLIGGAGQLLSLAIIFILTKTTEGSLTNLALYYSGVPCITMAVVSVYAFRHTNYKTICPKVCDIRPGLIKNILGLGMRFFFIHLCMIAVFQLISIVISREAGPESVTEYNISYKYFSILMSIFTIIVTPYWTAFTDAHIKGDYKWMKDTLKQLELVWIVSMFVELLMFALSPLFLKLWIGNTVSVSIALSTAVAIYMAMQNLANIYCYIINGLGVLWVQLFIYALFAVISLPIMTLCCRTLGSFGALIVPTSANAVLAVMMKIQISKILNGTASGFWIK